MTSKNVILEAGDARILGIIREKIPFSLPHLPEGPFIQFYCQYSVEIIPIHYEKTFISEVEYAYFGQMALSEFIDFLSKAKSALLNEFKEFNQEGYSSGKILWNYGHICLFMDEAYKKIYLQIIGELDNKKIPNKYLFPLSISKIAEWGAILSFDEK